MNYSLLIKSIKMQGNIEKSASNIFSNRGLQLTYRRFLSDSAGGFLLILIFIFLLKMNYGLISQIGGTIEIPIIGRELKVLILLLTFLLATPIGLILNTFSWFILGGIELWVVEKMINWNFLTRGTKIVTNYKKIKDVFSIKKGNFIETSYDVKNIMDYYFPKLKTDSDATSGARRFIRSINFLGIILIIYLVISSLSGIIPFLQCIIISIIIGIGIIFNTLMQANLRIYEMTHILNQAYSIIWQEYILEEKKHNLKYI